jgi:alkaline phosphatase
VITADHECAGVAIIGASTVTNASLTARASSGGGAAQLRAGVVGTYEAAAFPQYSIQPDGYPATMNVNYKMLIGYAANADRYEYWLTNPLPLRDSQQPTSGTSYGSIVSTLPNLPTNRDTAGNFLITGQVADTTAGDIPLSAIGRGAKTFTGYQDNTDVFFKIMQAAVGGAAN